MWAAPISLFLLGLFYYWFAVADRYAVFLYGHTTVGIPQARPFDEMTSSRYWMSGLVASGAVTVIYTTLNWALGRIAAWFKHDCGPPAGWKVWTLCAVPLIVGIPAMTMTLNSPTLPPGLAGACVVATLAGLALALLPGEWAARRPRDLLWLAFDGVGLMPALLLLRAIELPGRGVSVSVSMARVFAVGGILAGLVWLGMMTALRLWRHTSWPGASTLLMAGLSESYLLLPLAHHLLATPMAYRYISTASNFFAFNLGLQILVFGVATGLAVAAVWLRRRWVVLAIAK